MIGTTPARCHIDRAVAQTGIIIARDQQYWRQQWGRADIKLTSVQHPPQSASHWTPSSPLSQCCGNVGMRTASLASIHCCRNMSGSKPGRPFPIIWIDKAGVILAYSPSIHWRQDHFSSEAVEQQLPWTPAGNSQWRVICWTERRWMVTAVLAYPLSATWEMGPVDTSCSMQSWWASQLLHW